MNSMLLGAVVIALGVSLVGCVISLRLFPWFRSGERKEGHFRADQSTGSYRVDARKGLLRLRTAQAGSNELPLAGGPVMVLAVVAAGIGAGFMLNLDMTQWALLGILLLAMVGFGIVGFVDDWRKVHKGEGISEIQKFGGVMLVALAAAIALNRLIVSPRLSARLAYPPYSDFPVLGHLLVHAHFAWIIFFLLMTVTVTSATSLAVDFSDGMDGLCGGLLLSAALSIAAILLGEGGSDLWPSAIAVLALAGSVLGYLPFNWPSSWRARNMGWGKRRAVLIMGDTGSLAMGGLLALVAVISRLEFVLIFIGGVFVLEGVSALVSARILVRFFRRFLYLERYESTRGFPHTEFPLPFLATPMHYHYDLLGWDRKRLVYGAWLLGAGLGVLGVASTIGTFTWERYLARFAALIVILVVWQMGSWTRSYFIGLAQPVAPAAGAPRHLALYYGFPFKLFGQPLFSRVDTTEITAEALTSPAERLSLWQRMSGFDARSMLGYYCYRVGAFDDALRVWARIPRTNLEKRPDIEEMLAEVRHAIALQADEGADLAELSPAADDTTAPQPADGTAPPHALPHPDDPAGSQWRMSVPPANGLHATRLEPTGETPADEPPTPQAGAPLWNAMTYTNWIAGPEQPHIAPESNRSTDAIPADANVAPEDQQPTVSWNTIIEPAIEPVAESSGSRNQRPGPQS